MEIVISSLALLATIFILFLIYASKYNKKFKSLKEEYNIELEKLNNNLEENKELIETQMNVILSQRKELATLNIGIDKLKTKNETTESQKKSSEVRLGLMAENFMPFIRDYPYDHKNFRFLANPVDGLQVNDDSIVFVEFKTGGAKLSKSQKHIKDLVSKGKVRFETFRVDETGSSLKLESSMENLGE